MLKEPKIEKADNLAKIAEKLAKKQVVYVSNNKELTNNNFSEYVEPENLQAMLVTIQRYRLSATVLIDINLVKPEDQKALKTILNTLYIISKGSNVEIFCACENELLLEAIIPHVLKGGLTC